MRYAGLQIVGYQPDLAQAKNDGTHQLHLPLIAQQLKPCMLFHPDHMHMRRAMVVCENNHAPAFEGR